MVITIQAAKANLSRFIEKACAGEEIIIAKGKMPIVRLTPIAKSIPKRSFGAMKGRAKTTAAFFQDLPEEELKASNSSRAKRAE